MYLSKFNEKLDFNLRQGKESGDSADAESYRKLPRADTPEFIHDAVCELMRENQAKFTEEIVITLYDGGDAGYYPVRDGEKYYLNINSCVDDTILTIPEQIYEIHKMMIPLSSSRLGQWVAPFDNTVSSNSIYCPSKRTIHNEDGWAAGDVFRVTASIYPQKLKIETTLTVTSSSILGSSYTSFVVADNDLERGNIIIVASGTAGYAGTYTILHATQTAIIVALDSSALGAWTTGTITNDYDNQIMPVPDAYIRLLLLLVKRNSFSRIGKAMITYEYSELEGRLYPQWRADSDIINTTTKLRFRGAGFGRRRSR